MSVSKSNDILWTEIVKARADYKCVSCGKETDLHSHHIVPRTEYSSRWLVLNGICLCSFCHQKAHNNLREFNLWLIQKGIRTEEQLIYLNEKRKIDKFVMNDLLVQAALNFKININQKTK